MAADPSSTLTARRVAQTRREVAETALTLSRERGWDAVSVADLVAASGVSTRTFYRYFARKEDVFVPLLEEATGRLQRIFVTAAEPDLALRSAQALEQSLHDFPGGLGEAHRSYGILLSHDDLEPVWLAAAVRAEPGFAAALRQAFPTLDDGHDGRLAAAVIISCQRIALTDWVAGPADASLTRLAERAIRAGLGPLES
ncbi:MAG TPA: TetR family transcriptional regulator [Gryllotalpicola sp.]